MPGHPLSVSTRRLLLAALRRPLLALVMLALGGLLPAATPAVVQAGTADAEPCSAAWLAAIKAADSLSLAASDWLSPPVATERRADPGFDLGGRGGSRTLGPEDLDQSTLPNDISFLQRYQQNLRAMNAVEAWQVTYGADDVTVAIVADGVELGHEDLRNKIWRNPYELPGNGIDDDGNGYVDDSMGWDFGDDDSDASPIDDPEITRYFPPTGTAMAGLVAAQTNNEIGIAGIAWHARILPLKTTSLVDLGDRKAVGGRVDNITEAICYAANAGARVIVVGGISLKFPDRALQDLLETREAIKYAWTQKGALVVAPAGECGSSDWWCPDAETYGSNPPTYPASLAPEWLIGVASYEWKTLNQRRNASYGDWVDIAAPGENFYTSWRHDTYRGIDASYNTPSDMAAAHVAGVAALMLSANPSYTPEMVEGKLCEFATRDAGVAFEPGGRWPHNPRWGCGRLQAENAIDGMPWRIALSPHALTLPIDASLTERCASVESLNLNTGAYELVSDQPWLRSRALPQRPGERSRTEVCIDVAGLREAHGGRLMSGTVVTEQLESRAINLAQPTAQARSGGDTVTVSVSIVPRLFWSYLPSLSRGR